MAWTRAAPRTIRVGGIEAAILSGGRYRIDGGGMFGIVPKAIWERRAPPDARNRILLETNCLLVRAGGKRVLVDAGSGDKWGPKERDLYAFEPGDPLAGSLAAAGVEPSDVDAVVVSHLHFDHAGGLTRNAAGAIVPSFPRAEVFVQRGELDDAEAGYGTMRRSYLPENWRPIRDAGLLRPVEGDAEILPGIRAVVTGGHTRWHQAVLLHDGPEAAIYLGDLVPTRHHFRAPWNMAYDLEPAWTMARKLELLKIAKARGWTVFLDHDPEEPVGSVAADAEGEFALGAQAG